ncbi:hypothetical protein [Paenibacillus endoradicis]|uniref:hypothetical protein n=1 Tax=Paenibacillus endoradicis TaxID=2972487 RepID=UPI0021599685|nr:hypothetical protein [Paenibacillus endoradicis]MCR8655732.1 hypothetical protein [Paenibacillus endoradicis]MCR8658058.1 hypothetical protein [Paenibacillus endoradicis]
MRKKVIFTVFVLALLIILGLLTSKILSSSTFTVVNSDASYPAMSLEELSIEADKIFQGIVIKRGQSKLIKVPYSTDLEVNIKSEGKYFEFAVTKVEIKVTVPIKNTQKNEIIVYMEDGGTINNKTYISGDGQLQVGQEILIFSNEAGYSWGAQSLYSISEKDTVNLQLYNDMNVYNVNDLKTKIIEIIK